ncbi:phosphatase PAP2 family protein [Spiroplasma diminutum]|uniref:Phosphatidic acid phosphatase type 2/haloperoxidase domain-containing protein n=1 Tax=Spiroplasma diminutum CUAS-1 TaxID=1276221 RepID=S5MDT9_9MOLU|nr:phosphatase PAP2 family protein [Spiroplasma diminutum]AGR41883.1 hypothetical protein SDIMI_v3c01790 [Spiroplasma diminutum CUAS-1]
MRKNIKGNYLYITALSIFLVFFITFTFLDLKISKSISNEMNNHWFSQTFDMYGKTIIIVPIYLIFFGYFIKLMSFVNLVKKAIRAFNVLFNIIFIFTITTYFYYEFDINSLAKIISLSLIYVFIFIFIVLIAFNWIKLIYNNDQIAINKIVYAANISIIFLFIGFLNVELFKNLFGRIRPNEVIENDQSFFYVFQINFSSKRGKSFPSGHTLSAGQLIAVFYFLDLKNKRLESILKKVIPVFVIIFTLLTAISRVTMHKHFPTDVLFSMLILVVYYLLSPIIIKKIYERKIKNG